MRPVEHEEKLADFDNDETREQMRVINGLLDGLSPEKSEAIRSAIEDYAITVCNTGYLQGFKDGAELGRMQGAKELGYKLMEQARMEALKQIPVSDVLN